MPSTFYLPRNLPLSAQCGVQQGQHELVVAPLRAESAQVLAGLVLIVWNVRGHRAIMSGHAVCCLLLCAVRGINLLLVRDP